MNNHPFTIQRGVYATVFLKQDSEATSFYGVILSADNIGISMNVINATFITREGRVFPSQENPDALFIPLDSISYVKVWGV